MQSLPEMAGPIDIPGALRTPFLWLDLAKVGENVQRLRDAFAGVDISYAVKCNPDPRVLRTLLERDVGFEVASPAEARAVLEMGASPARVMCLHPIKSKEFLRFLQAHGIDILAADSREEIDKIAEVAPGSRIVLRVDVPNTGSVWDLSDKFGASPDLALEMMSHAAAVGLRPYGITMHVGSQCTSLDTWEQGLSICGALWKQCGLADQPESMLSLGGGLPIRYRKPIPDWFAFGARVADFRANHALARCRFSLEPGRAIVGSAGTLVTTVVGTALRRDAHWVYIDAGSYHGLSEAIETPDRQLYPLRVQHPERPIRYYHIGGPTCAGHDSPFRQVALPELRYGDRVFITHAGAYSTSCASPFNGFPVPRTHYAQDWLREVSHHAAQKVCT